MTLLQGSRHLCEHDAQYMKGLNVLVMNGVLGVSQRKRSVLLVSTSCREGFLLAYFTNTD